jgi:hypothetical protein
VYVDLDSTHRDVYGYAKRNWIGPSVPAS